jgi:hypothetical protein
MKPIALILASQLTLWIVGAHGGQFDGSLLTYKILPLALESAQLSEQRGDLRVDDGIMDGTSYIAKWQKRQIASRTWFFTRLHSEAFAQRTAPLSGTTSYSGGGGSTVVWTENVKLVHLNPNPGETNLAGQTVKLRIKLRAKGRWRALGLDGAFPNQPDNSTSANLAVSAGNPSVNLFNGRVEGDADDQSFEQELWMPTIMPTIGQSGNTFTTRFSLSTGVNAANRPNQIQADGLIFADLVMAGFQVLDLSDNLIWEYAAYPDGSPGDRFALVLYPSGGGPGFPLAPGPSPVSIDIRRAANGNPEVDYEGILQQSTHLGGWQDVIPQPAPPFEISTGSTPHQFFRARTP